MKRIFSNNVYFSWDDPSNHHVNHWEVPSYVLFITPQIEQALKSVMKPILEVRMLIRFFLHLFLPSSQKWIGGKTPLTYSMTYGIRIYVNNSYLLNHVDRSATHAVSAILQVEEKINHRRKIR
jgi:hypothetical protein